MAVVLGLHHAALAALTEDGALLVCGANEYGSLGVGLPAVPHARGWWEMVLLGGEPGADTHPFASEPLLAVAMGRMHMAAVTERGGVWVWGLNHYDQLGPIPVPPDAPRFRHFPVRWDASVCGGAPVVMVACGDAFTLALTRAGLVWSCGDATFGKTGQAAQVPPEALTRVLGLERIKMVVASDRASLAVAQDGRLWSWGDSSVCPLADVAPGGDRDNRTPHVPRALELSAFGGSRVLFAAAGVFHAAAVTEAGGLWTWGHDRSGCLGLGRMDPAHRLRRAPTRVGTGGAFAGASVLMAACGYDHTVVLADGGAVWTCGSGVSNALGHVPFVPCLVPTRVPQASFGDRPVVCVAAGLNASMAVTAEGVLHAWGTGALGHGGPDGSARIRVPTAVAATLPPGARVARTSAIAPGHSLAFMSGTFGRLGVERCEYHLVPTDVLKLIVRSDPAPGGAYARMGEGLLRLLAVRLRAAP